VPNCRPGPWANLRCRLPNQQRQGSQWPLLRVRGVRLHRGLQVLELRGAYRKLLRRLGGLLAKEFGVRADPAAIRQEARIRTRSLADRVFEPRLRSFVQALGDTGLEDEDWLAALALNLTGRPAPSWRDEDETRFGLELRRMMRTLQDAEVLSFEALAPPDSAAIARRITVSSPGGDAVSRVVWLDAEELRILQPQFDSFLSSIERTAGLDALETLLALVAERFGLGRDDQAAPVDSSTPEEGLIRS